MASAKTEPFVVIWSLKDREQQPDLYDTMKRLAEPDMIETIKNIARKYGLPGIEFQLREINAVYDSEYDELDGMFGVSLCYDQNTIPKECHSIWDLMSKVKIDILPMIKTNSIIYKFDDVELEDYYAGCRDYQQSGELREHHDRCYAKLYGLEKIFDSRPVSQGF